MFNIHNLIKIYIQVYEWNKWKCMELYNNDNKSAIISIFGLTLLYF